MTENKKDCWQCRVTSGGGLIGAGTYVIYQSKKLKTFSRHIVAALGYGLSMIGTLKLLDLPPFSTESHLNEKDKIDSTEENEYIIGKFP